MIAVRRINTLLRRYLGILRREETVILLGAALFLALNHHHGSPGYFRGQLSPSFPTHPAKAALPYLWWFGCSVLFYLALPLLLSKLTRGAFHRSYGLGLGNAREGFFVSAVFLAVMLPAVYGAAQFKTFTSHYPLGGQGAFTLSLPGGKTEVSYTLFALYEAGYLAYFVAWEFFFRGWMLNGLLKRWGRAGAILIPTLPFVLMHFGKPEAEALGSIVAGVALAILALRTRSFWYGALLHGLIAVSMDVLSAWPYLAASKTS